MTGRYNQYVSITPEKKEDTAFQKTCLCSGDDLSCPFAGFVSDIYSAQYPQPVQNTTIRGQLAGQYTNNPPLYRDRIIAALDQVGLLLTPIHGNPVFSCASDIPAVQEVERGEWERGIYLCSTRLGLIKMDHRHSGNGRNSQQ